MITHRLGRFIVHRRSHLLALAALAFAIVAGTPTGAITDRTAGIRDALIAAGAHFSGISEYITRVNLARSLHS
ncbi:hypothetical protein ACFMQL_02145 [Nonomuraea fastidiosa]|uniref:hypothetical protein n=1 Tax=Nonomuraea TaxID=83681 RepID=UPI00343F198E